MTVFDYKGNYICTFDTMKNSLNRLDKIAREVRLLMIECLRPLESHHIGCSFSIVDIVTFLYYQVLRVNLKKPKDPERDIFILSKGHAALAVYAVLCKKGFFSKNILMTYDRDGGKLPEHISSTVSGVEVSAGSLGHGLPIGIGFALASLSDKTAGRIIVLMSDGELNEGSNWEAIMFAGHHKLNNLIAIIDKNNFQGYGKTQDIINLDPLGDKFAVFNWNAYEVDGHDFASLINTFQKIEHCTNSKPHCIIANTIKGKGVPFFEGKFESHYKSIDENVKNQILNNLRKKS